MIIKQRRFRLLVTITMLFTALIVVFGMVFRWYTYSKMSEIILSDVNRYFSQISEELAVEFSSTAKIAGQAVRVLGQTGIIQANRLEERLEYLPLFQAALLEQKEMSALQVGYASGDYFVMRNLSDRWARDHFNAPKGAAFLVDNIEASADGKGYLTRIWYTEDLKILQKAMPSMNDYDPRLRPWFIDALVSQSPVSTKPYLFHFSQEMGITIAFMPSNNGAVIAGDFSLENLSSILRKHQATARSEIILLERDKDQYWVTAYKDSEKIVRRENGIIKRVKAEDMGVAVISQAAEHPDVLLDSWRLSFAGEEWLGATKSLSNSQEEEQRYFVAAIIPENELFAEARSMQNQAMSFTLLMTLLAIPMTWYLAKRVADPIRQLAGDARRISKFDFEQHQSIHSRIQEVDELDVSMSMMESTICNFIELINSLSSEKDFGRLLERILMETMSISEADGAFSLIVDEKTGALQTSTIFLKTGEQHSGDIIPSGLLEGENHFSQALSAEKPVVEKLSVLMGGEALEKELDVSKPQAVLLPLKNREGESIGLLCLLFGAGQVDMESEEHSGRLAFIEALSGFAAVTLESRKMLMMQKELLESFIQLLAGAIDSKSPYTGGHCQRVPVITKMIAQKAVEATSGPFSDFSLSDEQWETIHIASWLHDCGKITTPEYVVDKATKLETIYDRIHEIRMRFEVLKRDAHLQYYQKVLEGGDVTSLREELEKQWQRLDQDFAFIAECNLGGEYMAPEKIQRLEEIGRQQWMRTLSDRVGVSWEESQRKERQPESPLPVAESLLDDRDDHLYRRDARYQMEEDNSHGFKLDVPHYMYNKGELYNLRTSRGTLNAEERYQINDHIVQTIIMLERLPFPKHLAEVPEIAGGHHEKIDGTGYPKKLKGEVMSTPAKMMVIADVFEALTASDRPYKKAKKLSEVIRIMSSMQKEQHIDRDIFRLFLESGVYKEYADQYLNKEQIDAVDLAQYLEN